MKKSYLVPWLSSVTEIFGRIEAEDCCCAIIGGRVLDLLYILALFL